MRRSRLIARKRLRSDDSKETLISDGEGMARFLLGKSYRTAMDTAMSQYNLASDKKVKQMWNNTRVWIGMLSDQGGAK